jgi:hypothetical protein
MRRSNRTVSMERRKVAMISNVVLESAALGVQQSLEAIDLLLELTAITNAKTGLLALLVDALPAIARAPATRRLCAIAFDLAILAQLTATERRLST